MMTSESNRFKIRGQEDRFDRFPAGLLKLIDNAKTFRCTYMQEEVVTNSKGRIRIEFMYGFR